MQARGIRHWLGAALLCLLSTVAVATPTFQAQLERADTLRSADPKQFKQLLGELEAGVAQATPAQKQQLRYLQAYRMAYDGQYDQAIREATVLFENADDVALKFRAGLLIVNSHAVTREYGAGLRQLDETLALRDRIVDRDLRHNGLTVAAVMYNQVGQYELGRGYA